MALVLTTALGLRSGSSTSPFYFSSSNSSVDLCGGWNAQLAGLKSELWDVAARLKLPWKPTALSHCQASPQMFGPWLLRSGTFRVVSLSRCRGCVSGHRAAGRWTFGPVWGPQPWLSLLVLSGVWVLGRKAQINEVLVDLLQRSHWVLGHACFSYSDCPFQFTGRRNKMLKMADWFFLQNECWS